GDVLGGAADFGGDQPRPRHAAVAHLVPADAQRADGAVDRGVAHAAGTRYPFAQPNDAGKGVDDAKSVAARASDQEPAIVGAEVERRIGRPAAVGPVAVIAMPVM